MLEMMLGLYLKSLLLATGVVVSLCLIWFFGRLIRKADKTKQERQLALYDMLMMMIVTIPILAFGIVALLMMKQVG